MRAGVLLSLVALLALIGPSVLADEGGAKDTVDMVVTIQPDSANGILKLQLELWVFDDADTLNGVSMGFSWDNPKLQMDSAKATSVMTTSGRGSNDCCATSTSTRSWRPNWRSREHRSRSTRSRAGGTSSRLCARRWRTQLSTPGPAGSRYNWIMGPMY